jgi:putative tricarboxylic transport membrane protein
VTGFNRDTIFSMLMLLLAIVAGWFSFSYPAASSGFPRVLTVFLGLMATLLLVRSLRENVAGAGDSTAKNLNVAAAVFGAAIVYAIGVQYVSFEIANFLFLAATMYLFGQRNAWVIAGVSTATMLLIKYHFFVLLDVSRPQGVWF